MEATKHGLHVVMLTSQFLPEVFGGAEQQCLRLSRELVGKGVKVTILTSRQNPQTPAKEELHGVSIVRFQTKHPPQIGGGKIGSTVAWFAALRRWFSVHGAQIDIVHCHQAKLNALAGVLLADKLSVPCIVKLGSAGPNLDLLSLEKKRFLYGKWAARQVVRRASMLIAISSEMLSDLQGYGVADDRCIFIPNGCEPFPLNGEERDRARRDIRQMHGVSDNDVLITFVGRLETQKNVLTLIDAFGEVLSAFPNARLAILGDGELMEEIKQRGQALFDGGNAFLAGRVSNVGDYLAASDVFVLPAFAEGMSNALLEAMSAGLPSIVSAVSGNTDLVLTGRTGWIYGDPSDKAALVGCLKEAVALEPNARREMGSAAKTCVQEHYEMPVVADRYIDLYRELITRSENTQVASET